mmetsp:Transcript_11272/g.27071  ORF Transcript_11272/g.27071 Transcript_11272/m.27071 type:complete len:280 (-) Transcript_11272:210-1049(-)
MNVTTTFILLAFLSNATAFPINRIESSTARQEQHRLFSSPDEDVVGNASNVNSAQKSRTKATGENPQALSNLLGDMFQAKLEMSRETRELKSLVSEDNDMPILGTDGIYRIINQRQLENFKAANSDKLLFLKFGSPICAACRMLKQKFQMLHRNPKFAGAPVVFADIVISNNKRVPDPFRDYITSQLEVQRIPTIHFYAGGSDAVVDQIFCEDGGGCSWPKIQQRMLDSVRQHDTTPTPTPQTHTASSAAAAVAPSSMPSVKMSKREKLRRIISFSWLR